MIRFAPAVAHQPIGHPYVARLPQHPRPVDVWDVAALATAGIRVVHVHFGFEHHSAPALAGWLDDVRAAGIAVVHTVHDLANPHVEDQRPFQELVDLLTTRADGLLTLSRHAAAVVAGRTGRRPVVIPHGPIFDTRHVARRRRTGSGVYVHAATCRPNLDVDLLVRLAEPARRYGGLHVHVRRPDSVRAQAVLDRLQRVRGICLAVSSRLDDRELQRRIAGAATVLLPYRWGTHSGLLEAAHDLGTPVLAPDVGALVEQGAIRIDPDDIDGSLAAAVTSRPVITARRRRRQQRRSTLRAPQHLPAARRGPMTTVLWYVHDHGHGHLQRARAVLRHVKVPVVVAAGPGLGRRSDFSTVTS